MYNWKSKLNWKIGIDGGDSKMIFSVISILVSICFCIVVMKGSQIEPAYKTKKIASVINNVLLVSPIIATITFFILFSTVLKGRLIERSSHALIVFVLWVYGTAFYVNILKFFKSKILFIYCLIGMIASIVSAIILTPLDRYCTLMFSSIHQMTYLLVGFMIILWYVTNLKYDDKKIFRK